MCEDGGVGMCSGGYDEGLTMWVRVWRGKAVR